MDLRLAEKLRGDLRRHRQVMAILLASLILLDVVLHWMESSVEIPFTPFTILWVVDLWGVDRSLRMLDVIARSSSAKEDGERSILIVPTRRCSWR